MNDEYLKYIDQKVTTDTNNIYTITKYISEGGNGFVFECESVKGKTYILKLLHTCSEVKISNFEKEIKLQKGINSKYIVKCVDSGKKCFGKQRNPRPFYIMEEYDSTLEDLINENKITPLSAYKYSLQLCKAVKAMHKNKEPIIHRDIKPENILYDKKNDNLLIGDFGLAHIDSKNKSINEGFVGNIDYHAPEQKLRGKNKVGTYTDIYSLGLIINVLFTKEIAQGENYKKIWEVAPYFSFVDFIVDRMIRHDISYRENDINSVLIDLEKYDLEYEVEESFFKVMYKDKGLKRGQIGELINLFSLFKYSLKNEMKWNEINLNYYCDYHFLCNEILKNTILMNCYYERIKEKFEYEGNTYEGKSIPYKSIDLTNDENRKIYEKFVNKIDGIKILDEMENVRNRIKKYFISICDYHAKEIFDNFKEIEDEVNYYCIDAPILYISYFICENLPEFKDWNYEVNSLIIFDKYEASDISNKRVFTHDINKNLKELSNIIKMLIGEATCSIKNDKLEISFENLFEEERFEKIINEIANTYCESDVRKEDLLDIVRNNISVGLKKIYIIDNFNAGYIVNIHNSNNLEF